MNTPPEHLPVMPYLIVSDAHLFLEFTKLVFGATEQCAFPTPDNKIMHGEIRIGDAVIMFADSSEEWKEKSAALYMYVTGVDAVYKKALEHKCRKLQEPVQKEYAYTGGFEDPFGNQWFLAEAPAN